MFIVSRKFSIYNSTISFHSRKKTWGQVTRLLLGDAVKHTGFWPCRRLSCVSFCLEEVEKESLKIISKKNWISIKSVYGFVSRNCNLKWFWWFKNVFFLSFTSQQSFLAVVHLNKEQMICIRIVFDVFLCVFCDDHAVTEIDGTFSFVCKTNVT